MLASFSKPYHFIVSKFKTMRLEIMLTSVFHKSSPLLLMGEDAKISWIRSKLNSLEKEELLLCFLAVSLLTLPVSLVMM